MKKQYSKPVILIEDFKMAESIAIPCKGVTHAGNSLGSSNQSDKTVCGWNTGGFIYWTSKLNGCNDEVDLDFEIDGGCYNNPSEGNSIFNSI